MSLPLVKVSKYDLLMGNISPILAEECLVVSEDTGEIAHWNPKEYFDIYGNEQLKQYTKLIKQITSAAQNIGYAVDINGRIEPPYQKQHETIADIRYTSRKEAIDPYSRMTLKVDGKHILCLSCGRFIRTPKIGKYNDRYCDNCGCYMPETMFGKEKNEKKNF